MWLRSGSCCALALALAILGCTDEQVQPAPSPAGGGGSGGSAGGGGMGGAGGAEPPGEPEPIVVEQWMVAKVASSFDPVITAIVDGTFELPPVGEYLGVQWLAVPPGENGALIKAGTDYIYAAARIQVPAGQHAFARGDTVAAFYTDNARRHPGDFYHSRKMRTPLAAHDGEHLLVARALGRRNTPEVELWSTGAELVINDADLTVPDLVVGDPTERPLGVAVLNTTGEAIGAVSARVAASDDFEATELLYPSLGPDAVTQLSFLLRPKQAPAEEDADLPVTLELDSPNLEWSYRREVTVHVVAAGARWRNTRISAVDGSTQYHAVMPPQSVEPGKEYGLIVSLHGAGVEAKGQAEAYGFMDWAYLVAPTNRRPFGFDWEEWGRLDALEALEDARATLPVDDTRIHLSGHSMGGHGTWHVGVHFTGRFGVIAPSAGWISFDNYGGGGPFPDGPVGRARAASKTLDFVDNYAAAKAVYIIHGDKDDNVPISHAKKMFDTLSPIVADLTFHIEPGAGHWWDNDPDEPGADCVDFKPMIDKAEATTLDPLPLDFTFKTPGAWVSSRRSFVTISSCLSPMADCSVSSSAAGGDVTVTTDNVRTLIVDTAALKDKGATSLTVDGESQALSGGDLAVGPSGGKVPAVHGPLNQLFHRPFCFVWQDDGPRAYRDYAAWMLSWWSIIGNGHGCGLPLGALTDDIRQTRNLVFLGVAPGEVDGENLPIDWSDDGVTVGNKSFAAAALAFVYPHEGHLNGYFAAAAGNEDLLFRYTPFSSRAGMPDFLVFDGAGIVATGFFDADWQLDPTYAEGI